MQGMIEVDRGRACEAFTVGKEKFEIENRMDILPPYDSVAAPARPRIYLQSLPQIDLAVQ